MKQKTRFILAVTFALFMGGQVSAQEQVHESLVDRVDTITIPYLSKYRVGINDHWFFGGMGSAAVLFAEEDGHLPFGQRISPAWQFYFGKELFPTVSLRASVGMSKFTGWNSGQGGIYMHEVAGWFYDDTVRNYYESQGIDCSEGYMQHLTYLHANADLLFNIRNIAHTTYQSIHKFDVFGVVGADLMYLLPRDGYVRSRKVGLKVGALAEWNITDHFGLTAELSDVLVNATFDNEVGKGMSMNSFAMLSAGVVVRLGKTDYNFVRLVAPEDYARLQGVLTNVYEEYNQPITKEEILLAGASASEIGSLFAPSIVFDDDAVTYSEELQMVNLYRVAKFMNQNPNLKLVVIGNTDQCDSKLARRRAELIRDTLIKRYDIAPSRLKIALQNVNQEYNVNGRTQTVNFGAWI